jgi:hypothetical protein
MKYLPAIIPGEGVRSATIGKARTKINPKIVATRSIGDTVKSVVKKGIGFGAAGAALAGVSYLATEPSREYNMGPKTYEPRDLRKSIIYSGLEDI